MDPPPCVQNAMMTKDKKPFTYTPGGINLAEIKSPRMQRRIERNANIEGVTNIPQTQAPAQNFSNLPPSTLVAMQPQMHVQVFPSPPPPAPVSRGGNIPAPPPAPSSFPPPPPPPMHPLPTQKVMTENQVVERPDMTKIIPDNPMALLRKTGGPKPRTTYLDEVFGQTKQENSAPVYQQSQQQYSPPTQQNITPQYQQAKAAPIESSQQRSPPIQQQSSHPVQQQRTPPIQQQRSLPVQQQRSPPVQQQRSPPVQQQRSPPVQQQMSPPVQQQRSPAVQQQWNSPAQQQWSPPTQQQWSPPTQQSGVPQFQQQAAVGQQKSPEAPQVPPRWQPPIIERVDQPKNSNQTQQKPAPEAPLVLQNNVKRTNGQVGSIYIPPLNNQPKSPPTPPERFSSPAPQSPSTPTLKEAPKPWQQKHSQPEVPAWARRDTAQPQEQNQTVVQQSPQQQVPQQQPRWPQSAPKSPLAQQQPMQKTFPVTIEIRATQQPPSQAYNNRSQPSNQSQESHPNAVYVTQPIVLQHPGANLKRQPQNQPQHQQYHVEQSQYQNQQQGGNQRERVIPIQIEGAQRQTQPVRTPVTAGAERSFNRQQSWGNGAPTQSNSFRVLQKLTNTDIEDDENEPVIEHSPKFPSSFQQSPNDQLRRMKLAEGDKELMNKFKQGVDNELSHNEVDPRYKGAAIPSKAFKLLQNMTNGTQNNTTAPVPKTSGNKSPQVRTIPVQIEDATSKQYVPPSEQTVQEPKKYTGSSIPSRSFKILQAMTDSCGPGQSDL